MYRQALEHHKRKNNINKYMIYQPKLTPNTITEILKGALDVQEKKREI